MSRPSSRRPVALISLVFALAWIDFFACTRRAPSGRTIVRIEGGSDVTTLDGRWFGHDGERRVLVASDGEILGGNDAWFPYRASDGPDLRITADEAVARLGSIPIVLNLENEPGVAWLDRATDPEVRGLRVVVLRLPASAGALAALDRLARLNPGVGWDLAGATPRPEAADPGFAALRRFRPAYLLVGGKEIAGPVLEAVQPDALETLVLAEGGSSAALGRFPRLRRLWADLSDPGDPRLPGLRALSISSQKSDLSHILSIAPDLRELNARTHVDIQKLAEFTRLEALSLDLEPKDDPSALKSLPLRRLSLVSPTRAQLEAVVRDHPDLEELVALDARIGDPAFLEGLTRPKVLVLLPDSSGLDVSRLAPAGSLKLLVLSRDLFEKEPATAEAVRKRLPGCLVVPGEGACAGSGWLLLFAPAVALLGAGLARRRRVRAAA